VKILNGDKKWLLVFCFGLSLLAETGLAKDGVKKNDRDENGDNFTVASSTNIDFNEAMIDGKFLAPSGFFLQGRQAQALSQMVKLRPNFRQELRNSRAAVRSLVK